MTIPSLQEAPDLLAQLSRLCVLERAAQHLHVAQRFSHLESSLRLHLVDRDWHGVQHKYATFHEFCSSLEVPSLFFFRDLTRGVLQSTNCGNLLAKLRDNARLLRCEIELELNKALHEIITDLGYPFEDAIDWHAVRKPVHELIAVARCLHLLDPVGDSSLSR